MPGSVFVADGACLQPFADEAPHKCLYIRHRASAIVAHIDYQPVGRCTECKHRIEIPLTYPVGETRIMHIAHILRQDSIINAPRRTIVEVEIILLYKAGIIILRIVAPPFLIIRRSERG